MRALRYKQMTVVTLLFAGYAALYFCRADLSVGTPLIIEQLGRHGVSHHEAIVRMGTISSLGVLAYALGKLFLGGLGDFWGGRVSFPAEPPVSPCCSHSAGACRSSPWHGSAIGSPSRSPGLD
jgi:sugar phosphate permease